MIFEPAQRYRVTDGHEVAVHEQRDMSSRVIALLPSGTTIVCAEVIDTNQAKDASSTQATPTPPPTSPTSPPTSPSSPCMRISAPAGWIATDALEEAPRYRALALGWEAFEANHEEVAPGDQYNLIFPFTHEMLQDAGAEFLTEAFHAAGTLGHDNRVLSLSDYQRIDAGGASTSAAFDVVYEKPLAGLHTKLFVKMPAADPMRKFISSHMLYGETQIAMRFSQLSMPTPVTQYYFGDYCRRTSNGILVTERIGFGEEPIEPVLPKGLDHLLGEPLERYAVLTKLQAKLVAFQKKGQLGLDAEDVFPFRTKTTGYPPVELAPLLDFIEDKVGHLLPSKYSQPAFLSKLESDGQVILDNLPSLAGYLGQDVDYTGFCHANLNLDNAWFWRTPKGELRAGLIDWGAAGQMSLGQAFQGMLFATEPAKFLALRRTLVQQFVTTYYDASGVQLDDKKLLLHAKIASMTGLPLLVFAIKDALGRYSQATLRDHQSPADPRLSTDAGLGTMLAMLGTFLEEWFDTLEPREICLRVLDEIQGRSRD